MEVDCTVCIFTRIKHFETVVCEAGNDEKAVVHGNLVLEVILYNKFFNVEGLNLFNVFAAMVRILEPVGLWEEMQLKLVCEDVDSLCLHIENLLNRLFLNLADHLKNFRFKQRKQIVKFAFFVVRPLFVASVEETVRGLTIE